MLKVEPSIDPEQDYSLGNGYPSQFHFSHENGGSTGNGKSSHQTNSHFANSRPPQE